MTRYHFYRNVLKLAEKVEVVAIWWHATTSGKTGSPRDELNIKVIKSKAWKRLSGHCPHVQKNYFPLYHKNNYKIALMK